MFTKGDNNFKRVIVVVKIMQTVKVNFLQEVKAVKDVLTDMVFISVFIQYLSQVLTFQLYERIIIFWEGWGWCPFCTQLSSAYLFRAHLK